MTGIDVTQLVLVNVDRLRASRNMTIYSVAAAAGITHQYLYSLRLSTERAMSLDVLARLAFALRVHPSELLRKE
jgi:DNA-binding Xre family transcriptional regulator